MKHLDLFSGYGGFTIPAQKYGIETIGFSEVDKYAIQVLNYHYPNIKNYGDITKIKGEDLPTVDIITGGSPCQDLSVAGKGAGLDGVRSGLFFHFIRLIKEKQPTYFVWENVKGALSSSRGWDFARVQIEMEQAGYDVQWQVVNAKDFGVPQNRERIFAIGTRKGSGREVLFEQISSSQDIKTQQQVSSTIHAGYYKQGGRDQQYVEGGAVIYRGRPNMPYEKGHRTLRYEKYDKECPALTQNCAAGDQMNMVAIPNSNGNVHSLDANYWKGSNNPNKSRRSQIAVREATKRGYTVAEEGDSINLSVPNSKTRRGRVGKGVAQTIDTGVQQYTLDNMRIRRLTPLECERLMGLEDNWTNIGISDTQRYKLCGNGVVVNCVDYIYSLLKNA